MGTTWDIKSGATTITTGGNYPESKHYTSYICLNEGSYNFTIYDRYQDGMCCNEGDGGYNITVGSTVIKQGGQFGKEESTDFNIRARKNEDQTSSNPSDSPTASSNSPSAMKVPIPSPA